MMLMHAVGVAEHSNKQERTDACLTTTLCLLWHLLVYNEMPSYSMMLSHLTGRLQEVLRLGWKARQQTTSSQLSGHK